MTRSSPRPAPEIDRPLAEALARVRDGTHDDPFSVLGPHDGPTGRTIRAFQPDAAQLRALQDGTEATPPATGRGCAGRVRGRPARGRRLPAGGPQQRRGDMGP